jgi:hypothetical protein
MLKNATGSTYWTGLPAGPEHDNVVLNGTDFIVIETDNNNLTTFPETSVEDTQGKLDANDGWNQWFRIRALTAEQAEARLEDCYDQWYYYQNGGGDKEYLAKFTVEQCLNVVALPVGERHEIPT